MFSKKFELSGTKYTMLMNLVLSETNKKTIKKNYRICARNLPYKKAKSGPFTKRAQNIWPQGGPLINVR